MQLRKVKDYLDYSLLLYPLSPPWLLLSTSEAKRRDAWGLQSCYQGLGPSFLSVNFKFAVDFEWSNKGKALLYWNDIYEVQLSWIMSLTPLQLLEHSIWSFTSKFFDYLLRVVITIVTILSFFFFHNGCNVGVVITQYFFHLLLFPGSVHCNC